MNATHTKGNTMATEKKWNLTDDQVSIIRNAVKFDRGEIEPSRHNSNTLNSLEQKGVIERRTVTTPHCIISFTYFVVSDTCYKKLNITNPNKGL
jgi:hypothetical protein